MTLSAEDLLDACERLCDGLREGPVRDAARAEIDRLRTAGSELLVSRDASAVLFSAAVQPAQLLTDEDAVLDVPTDVLLRRWRQADAALSAAEPRTLAWLIACLAVEYARDAYHARTDAVAAATPSYLSGLPAVGL